MEETIKRSVHLSPSSVMKTRRSPGTHIVPGVRQDGTVLQQDFEVTYFHIRSNDRSDVVFFTVSPFVSSHSGTVWYTLSSGRFLTRWHHFPESPRKRSHAFFSFPNLQRIIQLSRSSPRHRVETGGAGPVGPSISTTNEPSLFPKAWT